VDHAVYGSAQQFRLFGCEKAGSGRPKYINHQFLIDGILYTQTPHDNTFYTFRDSLISQTLTCQIIPFFDKILNQKSKVQLKNIICLSDETVAICMEFLGDQRQCFEVSEVMDGLILLNRLYPSMCEKCNRKHENQNPFLSVTGKNVFFNCRRSADGKGYYIGSFNTKTLESIKEKKKTGKKEGGGIFYVGNYPINANMPDFHKMRSTYVQPFTISPTFQNDMSNLHVQIENNKIPPIKKFIVGAHSIKA
jgi:hypothetical protein